MVWIRPLAGLFSLLILWSPIASALDIGYEGYFRSRGNFHYNLDLDRSQKPQSRGFTDIRFRLNPTFYVSDQIRVHSSFNIMDGHLGDNPLRSMAHTNPGQAYDPLLDANESESVVGRPTNATSVYGGAYAPDAAVRTSGLTPIQMRRLWLELDTQFGIVKIGRMPNHFGYGIFANAGDDLDQEVGSSRDRILFDTSMGDYYLRPGMGWMQEANLDIPADDFFEYFLYFGKKAEDHHLAFYFTRQSQDAGRNAATNGDLVNASTSYWVIDFFAEGRFDDLSVGGEVALFTGKWMGFDLMAVNAVTRVQYQPKRWHLLTEMGLSTGTTAADIAAGDIKTYAFSRDYDVAYLLFEEVLPGGQALKDSSGTSISGATAPHAGAISNAVYGRLNVGYEVADYFHPSFNLVIPYAPKAAPNAGGKFYGFEYDLITKWPINPYVIGEFTFAHFIPNSFYKTISRAHSTLLIRGGLTVKF